MPEYVQVWLLYVQLPISMHNYPVTFCHSWSADKQTNLCEWSLWLKIWPSSNKWWIINSTKNLYFFNQHEQYIITNFILCFFHLRKTNHPVHFSHLNNVKQPLNLITLWPYLMPNRHREQRCNTRDVNSIFTSHKVCVWPGVNSTRTRFLRSEYKALCYAVP